jgi:hypothetical protein
MNKILTILGIMLLVGAIATPVLAHGPGWGRGRHMMGDWGNRSGYDSEGRFGMGHGMMGRGYSMGHGMMGRGMSRGMMQRDQGMEPQYGPQYQQPQKPLEEKDARAILENYLGSVRNPNLKLGKIEDKGETFEAEIITKNGSLVDRLAIDKRNGWMRSVYE